MTEASRLHAHSPARGSGRWHDLRDHLMGTARLARDFAEPFGGGDLAYWLGALHDIGKASCVWQEKLAIVAATGESVGIDHKGLGTRVAVERGLGAFAIGILGHHGGLIDARMLKSALSKSLSRAKGLTSAEAALPRLLPELPADLRSGVPEQWQRDPLLGEMAMRLCFSSLVDADFLDTNAHFNDQDTPRVRDRADFDALYERFENRRTAELAGRRRQSAVNGIRDQVYADCVSAADLPPGIYRLPAPTGAGKTLAGAGFALKHAARHGHRRVIVAVPFITITEQNAQVYRRMLDVEGEEPTVLEHHSQADFDNHEVNGRWARLAAENWDAPFIVTTFVRLFESLFGHRPAAMRRVHRLAGAVIVLDEIQALPHRLLVPILDGLRTLVKHFGTTVLLSSATQPSFWSLNGMKEFDAPNLVRDPQKLVNDLRRVRFEWQTDRQPSLSEIADQAASEATALVVVNTTRHATTVFDRWREQQPEETIFHLSTRMCPAHRRRKLDEVRARLRAKQPVLLVSTQLIEAGVDLDFPVVFRALAPADSLLQAAGRANREGTIAGGGRVIIFVPDEPGNPPEYKLLIACAERAFGPDRPPLDDQDALNRYYQDVYQTLNLSDRMHLGNQIQAARAEWGFETVARGPLIDGGGTKRDPGRAFRLIKDEGVAVVTPQGAQDDMVCAELESLVEKVRRAPIPESVDLRRLQPYTTNVHISAVKSAVKAPMQPILGSEITIGSLAEWCGDYDPHTGITLDPGAEKFVA